jgi:hypothetical protein
MEPRTIRVTGASGDERVELQLGELALHASGARHRGVRLVHEEGDPFEVALLGPDGFEEASWSEPVAATEIWELMARRKRANG